MRDSEIRHVLRAQLIDQHAGDPFCAVLDELEVCRGEARVDLAVANGRLDGFEIKSDKDSLARLPNQVEMYGRVFDRITIVSGRRHLERVLDVVPPWWAVSLAVAMEEGVQLRTVRRGRANPAPKPEHIVRLLDRRHVLDLLARRGLGSGMRTKPISDLRALCVAEVPLRVLRAAARDAVRARAVSRAAPSSA